MLQTLERRCPQLLMPRCLRPRGPRRWQNLPARQGCHFCRRTVSAPRWKTAQLIADYAGQPELQAAVALMPLYDDAPLPTSLRAAGYGADGQGAVLTPPVLERKLHPAAPFFAHGAALGHRTLRQLPHLGRAAPYHRRPALLRGSLRPVPLGRADSAGAAADGGHRGHAHLLGPGAAPLEGAVPPACIWTTRRSPACWNAGTRRRISAGVSRGWNCCCGPAVEWKFSQIPIIIRAVPQGGLPLCPR